MPISELLLLHHTHTDIGYTNPQAVFWDLSRRFIDQAIDLCAATAEFPEESKMRWTCEVTSTVLHWLDSAPPARIEQMRSLVSRGQIAFGAMWCHWSATVREDVLYESLLPVRRLREELGAAVGVAIAHDVNGLPWSAVEMLLDAGVEGLLMGINIHFGGFPLRRPTAFRWVGASGRSIPVFSGEHYNTFNRLAKPQLRDLDRMQQGIDKYLLRLQAKGYALPFAFLTATHPFCDDNNPPYSELPALVRRWNDAGRLPRLRFITPEALFHRLRDLPAEAMPSHSGDWTDYWTFGSGSAALELQAARAGHDALWDARLLGATTARAARWDRAAEKQAVRDLALADEHTFGAYCSTGGLQTTLQYEPLPVAEQWYPKGAAMFGGLSNARMLRRDALDGAAANPTGFDSADGLLAVNPAQIARRVSLRVPRRLLDRAEPFFNTVLHKLDVAGSMDDDRHSNWVGPFDLPPMSSRKIPLADLKTAIFHPDAKASSTTTESTWFALTIESGTGRILSLKDRKTGLELADTRAQFALFDAINETVANPSAESQRMRDPRLSLFNASMENYDRVHDDEDCWVHDWPAKYATGSCSQFHTSVSAVGAVLRREVSCPGVNGTMIQTITLCAHEPRVIFEAYFNKADVHEPDAIYFAFPFSAPGAQCWFDTAGQAVAFDREQLPGACRDFITADSYIAVAGQDRCIALACPDAPLFQIGGMNFGRGIRSSAGLNQATLFAWPMNNYWNTNYRVSQPGFVRIRFEMTAFANFDAAACTRFADSASHPVVWHPMASCPSDQTQMLVEIDSSAVTLVQIKKAAQGTGIVIRLRNHSAIAVATSFALPATAIRHARLGDSLERPGNELPVRDGRVSISIPPRSTVTVRGWMRPAGRKPQMAPNV